MQTVILTVGALMTIMLAMAVGVIFSGRALKGSCGGVGGACPCDEAGRPGACKDGKGPPVDDDSVALSTSEGDDGLLIHEPMV